MLTHAVDLLSPLEMWTPALFISSFLQQKRLIQVQHAWNVQQKRCQNSCCMREFLGFMLQLFFAPAPLYTFPSKQSPCECAHCSSMSWLKLALFGCGLVATGVLCLQNVHSLLSEHSRESKGKALHTKWHTSCANEIFS